MRISLRGLGRALDPTRRQSVWQKAGRAAVKIAPYAAGLVPGVGTLGAMAIGAGSKLLSRDKSLGSMARGAMTGALSESVANKAGSLLRGGASAVPAPLPETLPPIPGTGAAAVPATSTVTGGMRGLTIPPPSSTLPAVRLPLASLSSAGPSALTASAKTLASTGAPAPSRGLFAGLGRWASANPELAVGGLSTAANLYGGYQTGAAMDRELALREEQMRRELAIQEQDAARRNRRGSIPYDQWEAERNRLRGTYGYGA